MLTPVQTVRTLHAFWVEAEREILFPFQIRTEMAKAGPIVVFV
jgi:hypothetical protein